MGFLDNSTITVDAILTKRGRSILSQGGNFKITKFALSDEEVDYTLYDVTHPDGTDSYGSVIENISLLEAFPNRGAFRSFLTDESLAGATLVVDTENYTAVQKGSTVSITPQTTQGPAENYSFTIGNMNILEFEAAPTLRTRTAASANLIAKSINQDGTTTVTIVGQNSGLVKVVTVTVKIDPASTVSPLGAFTMGPLQELG